MPSTDVELHGHIIDSYILPRVWAAIMDAGAHYHVREMRIGQSESETSYVRLEVMADTPEALDELVLELQQLGATLAEQRDAKTRPVVQAGGLPDDFYSTTNPATPVSAEGEGVGVAGIRMDRGNVVGPEGP